MGVKGRRPGDRKDGTLIRKLDPMHFIVPLLYPNRCDNEAYISERIELSALNAYLKKKNEPEQEFPCTMFHLITAAMIKTLTLRPKMNRFIANKNFYQRNEVSAAFVVKKQFSDHGAEALAFIHAVPEDTLDTLRAKLWKQISACRGDKLDASTDSMDMFNRMPRFLSKAIIRFLRVLDVHGKVPQSLIDTDPYYSSVLLSNVGSIGLKCGYHHLTNWGTNSVFCLIGQKKKSPFFLENGSVVLRETVELGLTIDERLADGYYYAKSIRLLKKLLESPELLEKPMNEEVEY